MIRAVKVVRNKDMACVKASNYFVVPKITLKRYPTKQVKLDHEELILLI
jgi:hypothetical protein